MIAGLDVPETGLSLRNGEQSGDLTSKPSQVMRLSFAQDTLDELIANLQEDQPVRLRLGKHPTIHYAGKTQSFHAYPETHRSEIYQTTSDNKPTLYFAGVMSHSLEVEKAKQATVATDQALANLEESLNAFERGKESKKTHMIQHPDELKVLQAATAGNSSHRGPKSKAELDRDRLLRNAASRSLTSSPTLGAPKSPAPVPTPTSAPSSQTKTNTRLEAMKTPFIHLLAVRAVSAKFLARQTRSTIEDCATLAQKYGVENRLNREKFDLKDKTYKDLDVWDFPYPTPEDRQEAIENAISAFDRMRISRADKLWQLLLPKEERGKGKCLSRLNLRAGPIKKPALPKAQVDGADDTGKDSDSTGNETDRRTGAGAASKKSGHVSRSAATTPKSRTEKESAKKTPKGKSTNNSTLTGRITKKTGGKPPVKSESKFKSAEFVHDSDDEDDDMPDVAPSPPTRSQPSEQTKTASPKKSQAPAKPCPAATTTAPAMKGPSKSQTAAPKLESSKTTSSKQPASRLSTSPKKPSPLGSSPPANASDVSGRSRSNSNNQSSSSSSSPLISQLARTNKAIAGTLPRTAKPATTTNGVPRPVSVSNPLKRKAEGDRLAAHPATTGRTTGNLEHKRRRAVSTASSGGSTGSASPPLSQELLRQKLWDKSQQFKQFYAKYSALHNKLEAQASPSHADLEKLQKQHARLHQMKQEIWDEHQRLRDGNLL